MVKITVNLNQDENLFLYSSKMESGLKSKAEVIKGLINMAMEREKGGP